MGRTILSDSVFSEFISSLLTYCEEGGHRFHHVDGAVQLFVIKSEKKVISLFIKVSTSKKGFWGLSKEWQQKIASLFAKGKKEIGDWAVVLLKDSKRGYILWSDDFVRLQPGFSFGNTQKYNEIKINEYTLRPELEFFGLKEFFSRINLKLNNP